MTLFIMAGISPHSALADPAEAAPWVIVHPETETGKLDRGILRAIFTLRLTRWKGGEKIQVFVLADDHPDHREFSKRTLGVFPYRLRQVWDRTVFAGLGQAPVEVKDQETMYRVVSENPGAIGYVNDGTHHKGVRYVAVQ